MTEQKVKVYKDIICLETYTPEGVGWWYAGGNLAFTPVHIRDIPQVKYVTLQGTRRPVLVVVLPKQGMVAINLPRSDTNALQACGLWHPSIQPPYANITYSPTPDKRTYKP